MMCHSVCMLLGFVTSCAPAHCYIAQVAEALSRRDAAVVASIAKTASATAALPSVRLSAASATALSDASDALTLVAGRGLGVGEGDGDSDRENDDDDDDGDSDRGIARRRAQDALDRTVSDIVTVQTKVKQALHVAFTKLQGSMKK